MAYKINVGDKIPAFATIDHEGIEIESEDLLGSPFVLYFYPKDDTPGCTKEACSFRDAMEEFENLDTTVIGVSPDGAEAHNRFREKYGLNFTLLCDENFGLARKFDVLQEKEVQGEKTKGVMRTTFVVDSSGTIRWIERPVSVEGHTERVIDALAAVR